jgi:hypothetical protein
MTREISSPSRRLVVGGLFGLTAIGRPAISGEQPGNDQWIAHPAAEDGEQRSWFTFGTMNGRPQIWAAHNAGQPWSCQLSRNGRILRLELRTGDKWRDEAQSSPLLERTMAQAIGEIDQPQAAVLPLATDIWWGFSFLFEPGPAVSTLGPNYDYFNFADVHCDNSVTHAHTVPLIFELAAGDLLRAEAHGTNLFPTGSYFIFQDSQPVQRGRWYDAVVRLNMDPTNATGRGGADIYIDGEQVARYEGPLGFVNDRPYAQYQIYRGNPKPGIIVHEIDTLRIANHQVLTTGDLMARVRRSPSLMPQ